MMYNAYVFLVSIDVLFCIFFFKQKTAYEMRISDWSSDVCSSDLLVEMSPRRIDAYARAASAAAERVQDTRRSIVGGERTNLDALDAERQRDRKSTRLNSSH